MPRKHRKRASRLVPIVLAVWAAWLLRRVERDYEEQECLSSRTSAAGWALYLVHAALTVSAARRRQRPLPVGKALSVMLGGASALFGSYLFAAGVREFRSFEQMSGLKRGKLVKSGLYRYSCDPQVAGWGLVLLGAAIVGRSAMALVLVAAFFLINRLHAPIEERHLERTFGDEYRSYRAEVPRFWASRGERSRPEIERMQGYLREIESSVEKQWNMGLGERRHEVPGAESLLPGGIDCRLRPS